MTNICPDLHNKKIKPCLFYVKSGKPGFCSHRDHFRCIEYCARKHMTLSYSLLNDYTRCCRLLYWKWLMGWYSVTINIIPFLGGMMHNYLGYKHGDDPKQLVKLEEKRERVSREYEEIPSAFMLLKPVINAYHAVGLDQLKGKAEQRQLTQYDDFELKSIIDLEYTDPADGLRTIMDYKYTKNLDIYTFFNIEEQASIYFINNPQADKMVYRCIKRPEYKKMKKDSVQAFQERVYNQIVAHPLQWFQDKVFHRGEFDLDRRMRELEIVNDELVSKLASPVEAWIQNRTGCFAYGSWCDYHPLCTARVSPDGLPHLYKRMEIETQMSLAK
jgi:hypothetical protein